MRKRDRRLLRGRGQLVLNVAHKSQTHKKQTKCRKSFDECGRIMDVSMDDPVCLCVCVCNVAMYISAPVKTAGSF